MSPKDHSRMAKSAVRPGDLVTVRTGYPGTTAVVAPEVTEANCVDIIITRPGPTVVAEYLATWVNSDFGKGQVLSRQGGLAQQHFNVGEMKELAIALPPLAEQQRISAVLRSTSDRISSEELTVSKLRRLKLGLMEDLLTGRVRVTEILEGAAV
ncbi:MAG: restriction endonuclease subunit S [Archangiaceae bacterium]|nr:restriction endonuclease subunit S [Archangiaceae bacterium]